MFKKKVIVTGKKGILSSRVAEWLCLKEDIDVNQISLRGEKWKDIDFNGIDVIVHIAGVTPQNVKEETEYYRINYELTKELARKAVNEGVKQFIYISSMAVYGIGQQMIIAKGTIKEDTPCLPVSEYGKSKLLAEESLIELENEEFGVSIIRVPSIYGPDKTEYLEQYKYLNRKIPFVPDGFRRHYKSALYIDNLCELIFLCINSMSRGIFCPDDGEYSAVDYCTAITFDKKKSRLLGLLFELLLHNSERIRDYYGAICYSNELTNCFEGKYRVYNLKKAVQKSYEG